MAKERTGLQFLFVAVVWVAAGILKVCMVGRMLCNNRTFSCLHCYSIFDHCSSPALSSAPLGLIPINLPSYIQATLPILLFSQGGTALHWEMENWDIWDMRSLPSPPVFLPHSWGKFRQICSEELNFSRQRWVVEPKDGYPIPYL